MSETLKDDTQQAEPKPTAAPERGKELLQQRFVRGGAIGVLLVVIAVVVWVVRNNTSSSQSSPPPATTTGPVALSANGLRTIARVVGQPIYWAGPKRGYLYELTRTENGSVFVRYLPRGVNAGSRKSELTIATYRYPKALQALKNVSHGREHMLPGGGIALVDRRTPKSIHIAYPYVGYQVDVFDPSATRAQRVAFSGSVRPVS